MNELATWPPPYQVRISPKAKRIIYSVCVEKGLEIVLPVALRKRKIEPLIEAKKSWIQKQLAKISKHLQAQQAALQHPFPETIYLNSIDEKWSVFYEQAYRPKINLLTNSKTIYAYCDLKTNESILLLITWLKAKAKQELVPWLLQLSRETKLSFNQVTIRAQKTLWGSCSSKKNISLNYKLLFLPHALVRNILLHELCHTQHLNHTRSFWNLLAEFDPNYKAHNRMIKNPENYVPPWISTRVLG